MVATSGQSQPRKNKKVRKSRPLKPKEEAKDFLRTHLTRRPVKCLDLRNRMKAALWPNGSAKTAKNEFYAALEALIKSGEAVKPKRGYCQKAAPSKKMPAAPKKTDPPAPLPKQASPANGEFSRALATMAQAKKEAEETLKGLELEDATLAREAVELQKLLDAIPQKREALAAKRAEMERVIEAANSVLLPRPAAPAASPSAPAATHPSAN